MSNRANNAMSEYLIKIQLIITNTEFKNKNEASKYETIDSKMNGEAYVRAKKETDIFESYKYDPITLYTALEKYGIIDDEKIQYYISNQWAIPQPVKESLKIDARKIFINTYKEDNKYYCNLSGKPFEGNASNPADEIVMIPDEFYEIYKNDSAIYKNEPIHMMPSKYQELFMNSEYYKKTLEEYPNVTYLKYIGSNSIPIEVSRSCKDGDIMKINTSKLSSFHESYGNITVSSDVIHTFISSYKKCRDYVFGTLRGDFSNIYANYDSFVRFLTIYISIGATLNELVRSTNTIIHENMDTANNFFMLYGLPNSIMEGSSLIEFLKKFRLLLQDKGTNEVYRVKDLIGYEYTDIYSLILVKQQIFENGMPLYVYDQETQKNYPLQKLVFRRFGVTNDNTSYFKFKEENKSFSLKEITSKDPRWWIPVHDEDEYEWWKTAETERMLHEMNYSLSNSKYIQLDTHMSLSDIWWQCVILLRGLIDRRQETSFSIIKINQNINGSSEISVFDAILSLVILMDWNLVDANGRHFNGDIYLPNTESGDCVDLLFNGLNDDGSAKELIKGDPYKLSSFNFDIRETDKEWYYNDLKNYDYIKPEEFIPMLEDILDMKTNNIGVSLTHDVKYLYDYLVDKLRNCVTIMEYRQVSNVYNKLFLVNPVRNWYDNITFDPDIIIMDQYHITEKDLASFKNFYNQSDERINVSFNDEVFSVNIYAVMNENVENIMINNIYPFRNDEFISAFSNTVLNDFISPSLLQSSISESIKNNYKNIINDKVILDVGNTDEGPKNFESLLFRSNQSLYRYIYSLRNDKSELIKLIRTIIRSLESYTNSKLSALEFKALGVDDYFSILKEVISYFKSYMVEFASSEIYLVFDGLFDYGGNSNMINLYDEISNVSVNQLPYDSLTLHDVGFVNAENISHDKFNIHDEVIFRHITTYQNIKNLGYEIWYDYKDTISKTPWDIPDNEKVLANIVSNGNSGYRVIIHCDDLHVGSPYQVGHE